MDTLTSQQQTESLARVSSAAEKPMTKKDRDELIRVMKLRAKIAKDDVEARKAQIIAEGEAALARKFNERDAAFADLTTEARAYMNEVAQKIDARAAELGVPASFRPSTGMYWLSRGENDDPKRRAEMRKVLQTRAEATAKAAKLEVDRWSADIQTAIIAGGMTAEARTLLDRLPTAEALMPPLQLPELGS